MQNVRDVHIVIVKDRFLVGAVRLELLQGVIYLTSNLAVAVWG